MMNEKKKEESPQQHLQRSQQHQHYYYIKMKKKSITTLINEALDEQEEAQTTAQEEEENLFSPNVNRKANAKLISPDRRQLESSILWEKSRREKIANKKKLLEEKNLAELTFSPKINKTSKELQTDKSVYERLYSPAKTKKQIQQQEEEEEERDAKVALEKPLLSSPATANSRDLYQEAMQKAKEKQQFVNNEIAKEEAQREFVASERNSGLASKFWCKRIAGTHRPW